MIDGRRPPRVYDELEVEPEIDDTSLVQNPDRPSKKPKKNLEPRAASSSQPPTAEIPEQPIEVINLTDATDQPNEDTAIYGKNFPAPPPTTQTAQDTAPDASMQACTGSARAPDRTSWLAAQRAIMQSYQTSFANKRMRMGQDETAFFKNHVVMFSV